MVCLEWLPLSSYQVHFFFQGYIYIYYITILCFSHKGYMNSFLKLIEYAPYTYLTISQFCSSSCSNRSPLLCTSCFNAETRLHVFIKREWNNFMAGDQIIKILVRTTGVTRVTSICLSSCFCFDTNTLHLQYSCYLPNSKGPLIVTTRCSNVTAFTAQ